MFVVLYRPHCFRSHHNARQRLQHSCAGPCCLLPRAWAMKKIHGFFPVHRPVPTYRLAMSLLRHPRSLEVRAWEHKKVKQRHFACFVGCYCSNIVSWITWLYRWYWLAAVYLNNALIYSLSILRHQIYALIPNSWFRSICRTRFRKRWDSDAELDDTVFA